MLIKLLKPFSFLPAVLMMYIIFGFSSQDGATSAELSYKVSYTIVEVGTRILGENLEPQQIDSIAQRYNGLVRKIAHMAEYFILAITVSFPLYVYGLRGIWLMLVAGMICVAFACGDEYHQSLVEGRGPSKRDVAIDSFGVFWGIIVVRIIGWVGRNTIFHSRPKKAEPPQYNTRPHAYAENPQYTAQPHVYAENPQYTSHSHAYAENPMYNPSEMYRQEYSQDEEEEFVYNADQLSEDMSLKKLIHDLREQHNKK